MNLDTLFAEALARPDADREAFVDAHAPDEVTRKQLRRLLGAHLKAGKFLAGLPDTPVAADTHPPDRPPDGDALPPDLLGGRYRVTCVLGRGGMGIVYRAEQVEPIRRAVAVKVVRPGAASEVVLSRFEAERQTVAAMSHPHIAAVYDGGTTADGRPYFVMELVDGGVAITQYCVEHALTFADRLALFLDVCDAVQHAHQRGVLHRDLKPSNVLVARVEGRSTAKVIDFGVAKAIDAGPEPGTHTRPGTLIGTPEYMSPEQADLSSRDIDVRSDVYALAVLLYELVVGDTPIPRERVKASALLDVLQAVRCEEPPPVGGKRRGLPAELDWVVAKGLQKNRDHRYPSVAAFADDLRRMVRHEAVTAAPTGGWYRVRKFARRNWVAVSAVAAVFTALAAGTVGTTLGMWRAQESERLAEARRVEAEVNAFKAAAAETDAKAHATAAEAAGATATEAATKARRSEEVAVRERDSATAMLRFFTDDVLSLGTVKQQAMSNMPLDANVRLMTVIDAATPKIGTQFAGRPDLELRLRTMVGDYYAKSGHPGRARPQLNRAAELLDTVQGLSDSARLELHYWLGIGYGGCREYQLAHDHFTKGCKLAESMASPSPRMTAAVELGRIGAAVELGPPEPLLPATEGLIGTATAALGAEDDLVAEAQLVKGVLLVRVKKYPDAITHLKVVLAASEKRASVLHAYKARMLLACAHTQVNDFKTAEPMFVQLVKEEETIFGRTDRETVRTKYLLANTRLNLNDIPGATKGFTECRAWYQADKQRQDATYATLLYELAFCYTRVGEYTKAADCFAESADVSQAVSPSQTLVIAEKRYNAARAYHLVGDTDKAEQLVGQAVAGMRAGKEPSDLFLLALELNSTILCARKKYTEAEKLAAECVELGGKQAQGSEILFRAKSCLGAALTGQGKFADAEPHHLMAIKGMVACREAAKQPLTDPNYLTVLRRVIDLYDRWEKPDELARWKARLPKGGK